ncbi:MAG: class I SAM-dependent methyltransferase [Phycisphaerales bacterium]
MGASASLRRSVAASIDAPVAALPWTGEVFADLGSLGSSPRRVAGWLVAAGIGAGSRVLDLGCGKGAVAVEVAARCGCEVVGVDGFGAFVESAREAAARRGVADLCRFEVGDARDVGARWGGGRRKTFDAAMMIALFAMEEASAILRRVVRAGGVSVIDDCVSAGAAASEDAPYTREEARLVLEEHGDRVEREHVWTPSEVRRAEGTLQRRIARRVEEVSAREARSRGPLGELMRRQTAAAAELERDVRPAMWLVRRGSGGGR